MGDSLPQGWVLAKVNQVCEIIMGQSPPSESYNDNGEGLPFFQGKAEFTDVSPEVKKWCNKPTRIAQTGDILLSVRAPVGPTNVADTECCIGRGLAALRYNYNNMYIRYYLQFIKKDFEKIGTGTTFKAISKNHIHDLNILIAPLPEQHRIVEKIDELLTKLDYCIKTLKHTKNLLKTYRQALLSSAFNSINVITEKRMHEIIKETAIGLVKAQKEQNIDGNGMPYVKMNNIDMDGNIDLADVVYVEATDTEVNKYSLKYGDILINTRNSFELVGKTGIIKEDKTKRLYNNNLLRVRFCDGINPFFINCQLINPSLRNQIKQYKKATTNICALYQRDILNLKLKVPKLFEQDRVVYELESRFTIVEHLEKTIDDTLQKCEALKQSILKKAFDGRLVPQDPNDEPADKLLGRIKDEKGKLEGSATAQKRQRKGRKQ